MVDYGTDFASHGKLDSKGQVPIVSGIDNVKQAVRNRIKTYLGTYDFIDPEYGTLLKDHLGMKNNQISQEITCLEIETRVINDPRIKDATAEYDNGNYNLRLILVSDNDEDEEELFLENIL